MIVFVIITILLVILWGIGFFSSLLLTAYIISAIYFFFSLETKKIKCFIADNGSIDIEQPIQFSGKISARSFYNTWFIFLCVEQSDPLLSSDIKYNQSRKWLVVFNDNVDEQSYRLIARLIVNVR